MDTNSEIGHRRTLSILPEPNDLRRPLYLLGETPFLNSTNILIEALIFLVVNTIYFILKEEPDLYKRFGEEYLVYKKNVPMWIPKLKAYKPPK